MADGLASLLDRSIATSLSFLEDVMGPFRPRDFAVRLWDGTTWGPEKGQPKRFTMVLKHPGALRRMFFPPNELSLAEAYIYDDFDIEGNLESAFGLADYLAGLRWGVAERWKSARLLLSLPSDDHPRAGRQAARLRGLLHSKERDREAVIYHYDVAKDFYALWLDRRMVYSCAYFATPDDDLDTAQERKLDYVCRKLRLRRGERLLDIGCGFGGLILHAAGSYGAEAVGITLSRPQAEEANERIRRAGLSTACRAEVRDYREVDEPGRYDKIASIGMFEHVGESRLGEYFERAFRLLRPGGVFLNHAIACNPAWPPKKGPNFSDRYVFPDGELLPIGATVRVAETIGFELRDVESLREHYALTLRHWVRRLEARHEEARRMADEATYRVWRLFMSGAAHDFTTGRSNVYQTLFVKPEKGASGLPLTRKDWYT